MTRQVDGGGRAEKAERRMAAARALGLWDKVVAEGWGSLTSRETGSIGAFITHRLHNDQSGEDGEKH